MYTLVNRKNFSNIFANYSHISLNILIYLTEKEAIKLSHTSKVIGSKITELINNKFSGLADCWLKNQKNSDSESGNNEEHKNNNNKKKINNNESTNKKKNNLLKGIHKINDNITKMNIFALPSDLLPKVGPYKFIDGKTLKLENNSCSELKDKLLKENTNFFFGDESGKNIIAVNRSLVDNSLNMEPIENKNDHDKYSSLYQ